MEQEIYTPQTYWDHVAQRIGERANGNDLAGDDEPYYKYKRKKFLDILRSILFSEKKVIEIGSGPGANLLEIYKQGPSGLYGVDISENMIMLARNRIAEKDIHLLKIDGHQLPFAGNYFDIALTSTVLQHIVDEASLAGLVKDICRTTASDIYIFERIEKEKKILPTNIGRTISDYSVLFKNNGFSLNNTCFLYVHWSYIVCGTIRKLFNTKKRKEGEPASKISKQMQTICLAVTKRMDDLFRVKRDLAMLHFKRTEGAMSI